MSNDGLDPQYLAAMAPGTSAEELQQIAWNRPDLWNVILSHPNVYPGLAEWIRVESTAQVPQGHAPAGAPTQGPPTQMSPTQVPPTQAPPTQAPPTQVPPTQAPPKRGVSKGAILGIVAGALALVLLIGGGVWWFFLRDGTSGKNTNTAFDLLPDRGVVVDVSSFGPDVQLVPIGPKNQASLQVGNKQIVAFVADEQWGLAGIDPASTSALPMWIIPIEDSPSTCTAIGDTILLGGEEAFQIEGAVAKPITRGSSDGPAQEETDDVTEDSGDEGVPISLGSSATDDVPYGVNNGTLVNKAGEEMTALGDNGWPYYVLPPSSKGAPWIVSDGSSVAGVRGNDVLWIVTLPDGSAEVNGFGTDQGPSLTAAGDVALVGQPDAIIALDTRTGEEVWRVDTTVTSWSAGEGVLLVSDGSSIVLMEFPKDGVTGEGGSPIGSQQDPSSDLTWETVASATLEVPESCASAADIGAAPVTFVEGSGKVEGGSVFMKHLSSIVVEGQQYTAVAFMCTPSGGDTVPSVGVYTEELELAADLDFAAYLGVYAEDLALDGLLGQGSAVQILLSSEWDGFCWQCSPGSPAQVTMLWNGTRFVTMRVGDPSTIWDDDTRVEEVEVTARLTAADLANITLYMPVPPGLRDAPWQDVVFVGYEGVPSPSDGLTEVGILEQETTEMLVGGETFLVTSIFSQYGGPGASLLGSVCAISMDETVVCAVSPDIPTSYAWAQDISVSGDLVTYDVYTGDEFPYGTVTQRFDGHQFTLVSTSF